MAAPPFELTFPDNQIPLEKTITYNDSTGSTLRTISKQWKNQYELSSESTTLDNASTSQIAYSYGLGAQITEEDEYDFGSGGAPGSLLRKKITNYQAFSAIPFFPSLPSILDRPCQTIVYDSSGTNRVAETDYFYDGTTSSTPCATPTTQTLPGTGSYTGHDETLYGTSASVPRGNLTKVIKLCLQAAPACSSGNPTATFTYDETGQVTSATDPNGNTTQYSYADNYSVGTAPGNTNAFMTQITQPPANGVAHTEKFAYGYADGQLRSSQDQNDINAGRPGTTYLYNDPFARPTQINYPDGGETTISYNDAPPSPSVTTSRLMNTSNQFVTSTATTDGLGHVVKALLSTDPDCASGDRTDTTYDGLGRVFTVSNPYCTTSDPTYGLTTTTYDALGRPTQVTHSDGSTILTTYTGRATQVQDEGNGTQRVSRISQTDGLGRLASLCEVASGPFIAGGGSSASSLIGQNGSPAACGQDIAATGFLTTYQYSALDDLTQVNQGTMAPRTFVYDSLSRLMSTSNPESGTVTYTYDANGNLILKAAPAPNQTGSATLTTTHVYDALNRQTQKSYSDGTTTAVSYFYDVDPSGRTRQNAVGRMTEWSSITCLSMLYDYDPVGRVTSRYAYQPSNCSSGHPITNTYDLLGNTLSQADGNFHTSSYTYNTAGRLTGVTDSQTTSPTTLLSGVHYNALGQIVSATTGYGEVESYSYDNRGREKSSTITFNNNPVYSFNITSFAPNGDVLAATDSSNGNWTYSYDAFNRLVGSNQNNGAAVFNYVYDRFGNRWQQNGPHTFTATFTGNNPSNPANNNRIDGYTYDAAGNLMNDGTHTYTYDAENRLTKVDAGNTAIYTYDGEGHRASKDDTGTVNSGGNTPDPSGTTDFVYDKQGHLVHTEAPNSNTGWRGEVFAGNRHLATYSGGLVFDHADWLGTERNRDFPNPNNTQLPSNQNLTSLPFGDWLDISLGLTSETTPLNFTGQYHDFESDLDYFGARYYASTTGRFTSADWSASPEPVPYADFGNPQSLNLYSYVKNNPLNLTDPDGHCWVIFKFSEHLCNFVDYGLWKNDKELQSAIDSDREWLKDNFVSGGGYEAADVGNLNNREVWTLYNNVWLAAANGNVATPDDQYANAGAYIVNASFEKLQHIYDKHASDFGLSGPKNREQLAALDQKLKAEVADPTTQHIQGSYRGQQATIHVTQFQNAIVTDASGNVVAGFKLSAQQLNNVISGGRLN